MTRAHAARALLAHGPLTLAEFLEVTRWPYRSAQGVLSRLIEAGHVESQRIGRRSNQYRLAV